MRNVIELLAIASEENAPGPRAISDSDNVALNIFWPVVSTSKWLVVSTLASGGIGHGAFVPA